MGADEDNVGAFENSYLLEQNFEAIQERQQKKQIQLTLPTRKKNHNLYHSVVSIGKSYVVYSVFFPCELFICPLLLWSVWIALWQERTSFLPFHSPTFYPKYFHIHFIS